ncbi:MAG: hypothetical protein JSV68_11855 [Anaerolineaceae bacterium]|nr:MAG: hypothetical protein JSV68_11855 [Anaerolineaceae bacterium]
MNWNRCWVWLLQTLKTDIVIETAEATRTTQEIAILENPFRGLHAFTEANADNFFWSRN